MTERTERTERAERKGRLTAEQLAGMTSDSRIRYERQRISAALRRRVIRYAKRNRATTEQVYQWLRYDFPVGVTTIEKWLTRSGIHTG